MCKSINVNPRWPTSSVTQTKRFLKKINSKLKLFAVQTKTVVSRNQFLVRLERNNQLSRIKQADKPSLKSLSASQVDAGEDSCANCHTPQTISMERQQRKQLSETRAADVLQRPAEWRQERHALSESTQQACLQRLFSSRAVPKQRGINDNSNGFCSVWVTCFCSQHGNSGDTTTAFVTLIRHSPHCDFS